MLRKRKKSNKDKIIQLKDDVATVVPRPLFGAWLELEIPAFGQRTALEILADGDIDELLAYTKTYAEPSSFS